MREYGFFYGPRPDPIGYTEADCPKRVSFFSQVAQKRATPAPTVEPASTPCALPRNAAIAGSETAPRISGDCRLYVPVYSQFGIVSQKKAPPRPDLGFSREYCLEHHICVVCGDYMHESIRIGRLTARVTCSESCQKQWRKQRERRNKRTYKANLKAKESAQ